jgi:hypothetical protein
MVKYQKTMNEIKEILNSGTDEEIKEIKENFHQMMIMLNVRKCYANEYEKMLYNSIKKLHDSIILP